MRRPQLRAGRRIAEMTEELPSVTPISAGPARYRARRKVQGADVGMP
jgi:hypothetical protein